MRCTGDQGPEGRSATQFCRDWETCGRWWPGGAGAMGRQEEERISGSEVVVSSGDGKSVKPVPSS